MNATGNTSQIEQKVRQVPPMLNMDSIIVSRLFNLSHHVGVDDSMCDTVRRDRPHLPFRCLDAQYRRELVRVYLTNVETICRKFVDEKRASLATLREDAQGFRAFLGSLDPTRRRKLAKENGEVVLKV